MISHILHISQPILYILTCIIIMLVAPAYYCKCHHTVSIYIYIYIYFMCQDRNKRIWIWKFIVVNVVILWVSLYINAMNYINANVNAKSQRWNEMWNHGENHIYHALACYCIICKLLLVDSIKYLYCKRKIIRTWISATYGMDWRQTEPESTCIVFL